MATLQATRQESASIAKARLKFLSRKPALHSMRALPKQEPSPERLTLPPAPEPSPPSNDALTVLELRQLLLQTASIYPGWQLVSIQHRPTSDVLVANLVRSKDSDDPVRAIREGRVLQIIMDATGDLRIHHPHRQQEGLLTAFFYWLAAVFLPHGSASFARA